jgi:hypothetical protein
MFRPEKVVKVKAASSETASPKSHPNQDQAALAYRYVSLSLVALEILSIY